MLQLIKSRCGLKGRISMSGVKEKPETWNFDGESLEDHVARAMYGHAVDTVRKQAAKLDLQPQRLRTAFETARKESDRSAAILVFALAEDLMLDGMKRYLNADVKGGWDELVSSNGLLATANDRINFLYLLYWIYPAVYADLRLLKSIRNRFAHHAEIAGFEDQAIKSWIAAMSLTEASALKAVAEAGSALPNKFSARQLFLMRSTLVVTQLVANFAIAPEARAARVAPGHVEGDDWDDYPDNLKELNRIAAEAVLDVASGTDTQG